MKTITLLFSLFVCGSVCAEDERPLSGSAEIHWRQFTGTIASAKRVVIFVGTPHRRDVDPKPPATIEIEDYEFFREPRVATAELATQLTKLVSDVRSFRDYRGMKFCGGFHPDLCVEWQFEQNGQRWHKRAFVCLGCSEWRLVDRFSAVHTDMTKEAADEFRRIVRTLQPEK
jgi:hypothetical protein